LDAVDHLFPLKSGIRIGVAMKPPGPEMLMRSHLLHQIELVDDQLDHLAALQDLYLRLEIGFRRRKLRRGVGVL